MNFNDPPPKRKAGKKKGKQRLNPEDVAESNPELAQFLRQRRKAEARMNDSAEIDFYLCLVFQSKAQREQFLDNLPGVVHVLHETYVDGQTLAKVVGVKVDENVQGPLQSALNKRLTARTGIPDQGTDKIGDDYWGEGFG